jgi:hypothetical protein
MACCSTCISGFAAVVTLAAFIFDIVLFLIAKARINAVGHASIGNAVWLTLAAWLLLFFSGCFFAVGRCCITKRGPRNWDKRNGKDSDDPDTTYAEHVRMEAIKAEASRKTKQANTTDGGLPAFYETVPLTGRTEGDSVYTDRDDTVNHRAGGYAPAPPGTRAVDEYYTPTSPYTPATHRPERQASSYSHATSTYPRSPPTVATASPPLPTNNQYSPNTAYDPFSNSAPYYAHAAGGSSCTCHNCFFSWSTLIFSCLLDQTASPHDRQPSAYPSHDPYNNFASQSQPQTSHYAEPSFNPDTYNNTGILNTSPSPPMPAGATNPYITTSNPYTPYNTQSPPPQHIPQRQYSLSGDTYGGTLPAQPNSSYMYTGAGALSGGYTAPANTAREAVTRAPVVDGSQSNYNDAPPEYDAGVSGVTGHWGKQ